MRQAVAAGAAARALPLPLRHPARPAQAANTHVTVSLTGRRKLPKAVPDYYSPGNLDEAVLYIAGGGLDAWVAVPGALGWLMRQTASLRPQNG